LLVWVVVARCMLRRAMSAKRKMCAATLLASPRATVEAELGSSSWVLGAEEKSISRSLTAKDWAAAMAFINAVSEVAEASNHHPDVHLTKWRDVELVLTTHSAGGLTDLDISVAKAIDALPVDYSQRWLERLRLYDDPDEPIVSFDTTMYANGLNGDFFSDPATLMEQFAGGDAGGGGLFESAEDRDIARAKEDIVRELRVYGLRPGATVADLGAGTGLLEPLLSEAVGAEGSVEAVELSPSFREILQARCGHLTNVHIVPDSTTRSPALPDNSVDIALLIDVYHHLEYPRTYLANLRKALKRHAALCVIDFHRDPVKVSSRGPDWVLTHVRADQATFTDEISDAGFVKVKEVLMPQLPENYFLVFRKRPIPLSTPGAGWA